MCANKSDAYVDGGMYFNQNDKKLYVPTCGYYYISSHIFWLTESSVSIDSDNVHHQLRIERNCSYSDDTVLLRGFSYLAATVENFGRTSTHVGDVVKMCAGGAVSIYIPNNQPCCPYGRGFSTYISAFMVAKTTCEPPKTFDQPPL